MLRSRDHRNQNAHVGQRFSPPRTAPGRIPSRALAEQFIGLPADERQQVVWDNVRPLYQL